MYKFELPKEEYFCSRILYQEDGTLHTWATFKDMHTFFSIMVENEFNFNSLVRLGQYTKMDRGKVQFMITDEYRMSEVNANNSV